MDRDRVTWNTTFKFNGTLAKKKGTFQKKDLVITLEEKIVNKKTHQTKTNVLAKEELDLAHFVSEEDETTQTKDFEFSMGKAGKSKLKIVINSKCLKNISGT